MNPLWWLLYPLRLVRPGIPGVDYSLELTMKKEPAADAANHPTEDDVTTGMPSSQPPTVEPVQEVGQTDMRGQGQLWNMLKVHHVHGRRHQTQTSRPTSRGNLVLQQIAPVALCWLQDRHGQALHLQIRKRAFGALRVGMIMMMIWW